jgi:hypothetical protein
MMVNIEELLSKEKEAIPIKNRFFPNFSILPSENGRIGLNRLSACFYLVGPPKEELWLLLGPWPD